MDDNHLERIEPPPTIGPLTGGREPIAKGQEGRRREGGGKDCGDVKERRQKDEREFSSWRRTFTELSVVREDLDGRGTIDGTEGTA